MREPGELLSTMDAKVWADEFMETKARLGEKEFDHAMMLGWFANAIMAGFDEATRRQQATIADLQGQIAVERANKESAVACVDRDVKKMSALQQRVAQLEMDNRTYINERHENMKTIEALQANYDRVLGVVQALPVQEVDVALAEVVGVQLAGLSAKAFAELLTYRASLPAQPAQGPGVDEDGHCERCGLMIEPESETLEPHECPPGFCTDAEGETRA